ncbi:AAA family ATPase [Anabaena sp. WFMT]|uniref:AAA family ATPase n=1 Tax=Anabaena sp. WFMT TaxID=3449730 RepID=UPI003F2564E1
MNPAITVTQKQLSEFLLNVAVVRPVFIWGAPGIGKSSLVEEFAVEVGIPCVSLLGSQLAPEDLIGVPQIEEWVYVLAHCLLHLGFGHFQKRTHPREWNAACNYFIAKFLADLKFRIYPRKIPFFSQCF